MTILKTDYNTLQQMTKEIAPHVTHSDYKMGKGTLDGDFNWYVECKTPDTVICKGKVRFTRCLYDWESSVLYENPTVADALQAMEESIHATGDFHHVFFEGVCKPKKQPDGSFELEILAGS